jgi:hypothetical protein
VSPSVSPSWGDSGFGGLQNTGTAAQMRNFYTETGPDALPSTTNLTIMFWIRYDVARNPVKNWTVFELSDLWAESQPAWSFTAWESDDVHFEPFNGDSAWESDDYLDLLFGSIDDTLVLGQWYHCAYVKNGSTHTLYRNGSVVDYGSLVQPENSNSWATITEWLGTWDATDQQAGGVSLAQYRTWTSALTAGEIQAEMGSEVLVKTAGVFRAVPMVSVDGTDVSGQGRHMVVANASGWVRTTGPHGSRSPSVSPSASPSEGS